MAMVSVDSEDLLVLVRACKEYEIDGRACRSAMNTFRLNRTTKPQFAQLYGSFYQTERSSFEPLAERKYAPIVEAIERGVPVADALKQVADQMRR